MTITRNKLFLIIITAMSIIASLSTWHLHEIINSPATGSIRTSPSGQFIMEYVLVRSHFTNNTMAYLRITDKNSPEKTYRSPLYNTLGAEFRVFENDNKVGISWLSLDKESKTFTVSLPQWEEDWRNIFVSNTRYSVIKN